MTIKATTEPYLIHPYPSLTPFKPLPMTTQAYLTHRSKEPLKKIHQSFVARKVYDSGIRSLPSSSAHSPSENPSQQTESQSRNKGERKKNSPPPTSTIIPGSAFHGTLLCSTSAVTLIPAANKAPTISPKP